MASELFCKGNLWSSTPIQSRHDSGYRSEVSIGQKNDASPIRKKARKLCFSTDLKHCHEIEYIRERMKHMNLSPDKNAARLQVDSRIESNQTLSNSEDQSVQHQLASFSTDENYKKNNADKIIFSKFYQPSKYICIDNVQNKEYVYNKSDACSSKYNAFTDYMTTLEAKKKVDILHELNERGCTLVLSQVLSFLSCNDLRKSSCVSKEWQYIVLSDKRANERRKAYIKNRTQSPNKENRFQTNSHSRREKSMVFRVINGSTEVPQQPLNFDNLPGRFDSFIEEAKVLRDNESLMKCPKCSYPSKAESGNKYYCTRNLCGHKFCKHCLGPYLDYHMCTTPNLNFTLPDIIIGSKKSKKNLRRRYRSQ